VLIWETFVLKKPTDGYEQAGQLSKVLLYLSLHYTTLQIF